MTSFPILEPSNMQIPTSFTLFPPVSRKYHPSLVTKFPNSAPKVNQTWLSPIISRRICLSEVSGFGYAGSGTQRPILVGNKLKGWKGINLWLLRKSREVRLRFRWLYCQGWIGLEYFGFSLAEVRRTGALQHSKRCFALPLPERSSRMPAF